MHGAPDESNGSEERMSETAARLDLIWPGAALNDGMRWNWRGLSIDLYITCEGSDTSLGISIAAFI